MNDPGKIRPLAPRSEQRPERLFQFVQPTEGDLPPLETIEERAARDPRGLRGTGLRQFWLEAFRSQELTLDELYPLRLHAAWRITREWCCVVGLIVQPTQTIELALNDPDAGDPINDRNWRPAGDIKDERVQEVYDAIPGLPLVPPRPPKVKNEDSYDPNYDRRLLYWCRMMQRIAFGRLGVQVRQDGRYGTAGLFDPEFARVAWPRMGEIFAYEEYLVRETMKQLTDTNMQDTLSWLGRKHGLRDHEARQLLYMASGMATRYTQIDDESARALTLMRLEKLYGDCQEEFKVRDAVFVLREISRLRGLGKDEGANQGIHDLVRAMEQIGKEKSEKRIPPPPSA
jgi:hypothetical protein